jgi:streptogramin lyase
MCDISVLSTKNLSLIANIPVSSSVIREITFVHNNSLMLVASNGKNQTLFFDVISTNSYTPSIPSSIGVNRLCGLYAVNDSFIYIASWYSTVAFAPVSTLIFSNNTWILFSLPNTAPSITDEQIFQTTVDSCGRLWLANTGYGIRIFDPWGHSLLYQWPVSGNVNGFLLLDNYEFFVTDFQANQILHFNPNITQCTS